MREVKLYWWLGCLLLLNVAKAQTIIPLYEGAIPGAKQDSEYVEKVHVGEDGKRYISFVSKPTIEVFLAKHNPNGASVIICPGGGYQVLAIEHEGEELAKRFNEFGISAFVLKYRLPNTAIMEDKTIGPLQDLQQAILTIRTNAKKWKVDPHKVGLVGSSAGGHLAASAAVHFTQTLVANPQKISLRPDFLILLYPRISLVVGAESSSAKNLIGPSFTPERMGFFSVEQHVSETTPPTFLIHASDDQVVKVEHSILFYQALLHKKVPAEMHLYRGGGHGFGLHNKTSSTDWFLTLIGWLKDSKWMN